MTVYFIGMEGGKVYVHELDRTVDWSEITPWNFQYYAFRDEYDAQSVIEMENLDARIIPRTIEFDV